MSLLMQLLALGLGIGAYTIMTTYARWGWWIAGGLLFTSFVIGFVVYGWGEAALPVYIAGTNFAFLGLPVGRKHPVSRFLAWGFALWGLLGLVTLGAYVMIPFALGGLALTRDLARNRSH